MQTNAHISVPTARREAVSSPRAEAGDRRHSVYWCGLLAITVLMTFEPQIRGTLTLNPDYAGVQILPGIWLSDVGLLLPISLTLVSSALARKLMSNRALLVYGWVVSYGMLLGLLRGNSFSAITAEFRTSLALVTGLCLALVGPRKPERVLIGLLVVSLGVTIFSAGIVYTSPQYLLISTGVGVSEPSYFILSGLLLCLFAPNIILAHASGNRGFIVPAWANVGIALAVSVSIAQTRTLSYAIILAIALSVIGILVLSSRSGKFAYTSRNLAWVVLFMIILAGVFLWQQDNVAQFLNRVQTQGTSEDVNWSARIDEAQVAFETITELDQVFGQGFGTMSQRITATTSVANILHIGILNVWWRLGFPAFVLFLLLLGWFGIVYVSSLAQMLGSHASPRARAIVICAPGVFTLLLIAFFSGGWSISAMLSLGLLWGTYEHLKPYDVDGLLSL